MAGSRLDRVGTIFSRTTGLIKAGAIKYLDRPVWYDVYRVFPPKYEPHIDREAEKTEVLEILYYDDKYRAMFFKKFGLNPGGIARNFSDRNFEEPSQPFVDICLALKKDNPDRSDSEIFNEAVEKYKPLYSFDRKSDPDPVSELEEEAASKRHGRKPPTISAQSLLSLFKEAKEQQEKSGNKSTSTNSSDTSEIPKTN